MPEIIKQIDSSKNTANVLPDFCQGKTLFVLILVSELFVLAMVLAASGVLDFSWGYLALVSMLVQWIVLLSAGLACSLRRRLAGLRPTLALSCLYVMILLVTLVASLISQWVMAGFWITGWSAWQLDAAALLRNELVSAIMAGMVLRYLYLQNRLQQEQQSELMSRLQALQSRIRPHFLFNSMNSIASLIATDPVTAERLVEDMSELLRASLRDGTESTVSLEDELTLCQRYLDIEALRLGDRLQVVWQKSEVPADITIPQLTLQPILENAIYHGIQPLPQGGKVQVLVDYQPGKVEITVTNPLGLEHSAKAGHGMALTNIEHRLQAYYGERARLKTMKTDTQFITQISYPWSADA